jgi:hypothetical protein
MIYYVNPQAYWTASHQRNEETLLDPYLAWYTPHPYPYGPTHPIYSIPYLLTHYLYIITLLQFSNLVIYL